jgi:hypothetical protein
MALTVALIYNRRQTEPNTRYLIQATNTTHYASNLENAILLPKRSGCMGSLGLRLL